MITTILLLCLIGSSASSPIIQPETAIAATQNNNATSIILAHPQPNANGLECDACTFLAQGLNHTVFHNEKFVDIIESELEHICDILPSSVHDQCMNAVAEVAPEVMDKIGDYIADNACTELGVCK